MVYQKADGTYGTHEVYNLQHTYFLLRTGETVVITFGNDDRRQLVEEVRDTARRLDIPNVEKLIR